MKGRRLNDFCPRSEEQKWLDIVRVISERHSLRPGALQTVQRRVRGYSACELKVEVGRMVEFEKNESGRGVWWHVQVEMRDATWSWCRGGTAQRLLGPQEPCHSQGRHSRRRPAWLLNPWPR